jgi:hypothetical protein
MGDPKDPKGTALQRLLDERKRRPLHPGEQSAPEPAPIMARIGGANRLRETVSWTVWPGTQEKIGICLLSNDEVELAEIEAHQHLEERKLPPTAHAYAKEYEYARQIAILVRCLIDPETNALAFASFPQLSPCLSREEADALGGEWTDHQEAMAPLENRGMTDDDLREVWSEVKKARAWTQLDLFAPSTLRRLLRLLGEQPETPTPPPSSTSTSPTAPSSDDSAPKA